MKFIFTILLLTTNLNMATAYAQDARPNMGWYRALGVNQAKPNYSYRYCFDSNIQPDFYIVELPGGIPWRLAAAHTDTMQAYDNHFRGCVSVRFKHPIGKRELRFIHVKNGKKTIRSISVRVRLLLFQPTGMHCRGQICRIPSANH